MNSQIFGEKALTNANSETKARQGYRMVLLPKRSAAHPTHTEPTVHPTKKMEVVRWMAHSLEQYRSNCVTIE